MTKNAALTAEYAGEKTFAALRKERLFAERLRPLVFVAAFVCVFYLALAASIKGIEWTVPIDVLLGQASKASEVIFYNVRLPRTATATVVGAALALAGAVMQNVLRNPLASASTLGVSQGAAFGAALAGRCDGVCFCIRGGKRRGDSGAFACHAHFLGHDDFERHRAGSDVHRRHGHHPVLC